MNLNDYQRQSRATAQYPSIGHPVIYPALGLVNEAGESWKRHSNGRFLRNNGGTAYISES